MPSPKIGNENQGHFYGVSALSTSNAWAVGNGYLNGYYRTRAEHWNGTAWSIKATPNVGTNDLEQLESVAAISSNNVWAVGYSQLFSSYSTILMHWNGMKWKLVASPDPGTDNRLYGIAALSSKNLWAVGSTDGNMLILHYNGSTWSRVTVANRVGDTQDHLLAVARVPGTGQLWAVGEGFGGSGWVTLALRYSGGHWSGARTYRPATPHDTSTRRRGRDLPNQRLGGGLRLHRHQFRKRGPGRALERDQVVHQVHSQPGQIRPQGHRGPVVAQSLGRGLVQANHEHPPEDVGAASKRHDVLEGEQPEPDEVRQLLLRRGQGTQAGQPVGGGGQRPTRVGRPPAGGEVLPLSGYADGTVSPGLSSNAPMSHRGP